MIGSGGDHENKEKKLPHFLVKSLNTPIHSSNIFFGFAHNAKSAIFPYIDFIFGEICDINHGHNPQKIFLI